MNRYILILTMSNQANLDKLLTPLYWESTEGAMTIILNQGGGKIKVPRKAIVYHSDENLGCAGGRKFLIQQLLPDLERDDQLVFLDDDVEVLDRYWLWRLCAPLVGEYSISGVDGRRITKDVLSEPCMDKPDYLSGGWCAIRGDVFLDGCMFDIIYNPNYYEDVDICKQATSKGKKLIAVENAGLRHVHEPNEKMAHQVMMSREKFIAKWGL